MREDQRTTSQYETTIDITVHASGKRRARGHLSRQGPASEQPVHRALGAQVAPLVQQRESKRCDPRSPVSCDPADDQVGDYPGPAGLV